MSTEPHCGSNLKLLYGSVQCDLIEGHSGLHTRASWKWTTDQGIESWSESEEYGE